jgi:hypothetical protein
LTWQHITNSPPEYPRREFVTSAWSPFVILLINNPLLLHSALIGQWRYSLITDKPTVAMQIAKRINSQAQEQNGAVLMLGASHALACTHYFLGDFDTARQSALRGLHIWHSGDVKSHVQEVDPPVVACLTDKAQSEWHLGIVMK